MARPRVELHAILEGLTETVYFQAPPTKDMDYPCIVYKKDDEDTRFANNRPYVRMKRYQITVIDREPDSGIADNVAELPACTFDRQYTANGLYHDVYKLFF